MVISDKLYRIITREGFEKEFWADLRLCRGNDIACTRKGVYETLEAIYEGEFGKRQFPSYEAFVKFINRKVTKGQMS